MKILQFTLALRGARRLFLAVSLIAGSLAAIVIPAHAADSSLLFGQKQAYTAVVRSDKKVITYGKIYLSNDDGSERKTTEFKLPDGVKVTSLSVYQITLPERCKTAETTTTRTTYTDTYSCSNLEDQVFGLDNYYYGYDTSGSELVYKRIDLNGQPGPSYALTLPEPIAPQKRGAYLVSYVADQGYVTGNFGLYNLTFKTLSVPESIQEVRVSIDVSEDLYTKAKRSTISSELSSGALSSGAADASGNVRSKSLDTLQSNIGSGGTFTKTGKSLAPHETFTVNGEFADAAWKLNLGLIIGSIVGLIVVTGLIILLMRKAREQPVATPKGKRRGK